MFKLIKNKSSQSGMASLVVTAILVALLSMISVSYSLVARREASKAVENQIGHSAYYAAESGINQAAAYALNWATNHPNTGKTITNCSTLLTGGGGGGAPAISPDVSSTGSTKYTCVLVNTALPSLEYSPITAYKSAVIRVSPSTSMDKMLLSWQTTGTSNINGVSSAGTPHHDETIWGNANYEPMLRISIYSVQANDTIDSASRTYFLYPTAGSATSSVPSISYSGATNPSDQKGACYYHGNGDEKMSAGGFGNITDYDCNIIISDLPSIGSGGGGQGSFYLQVTPLYSSAGLRIKGLDNSGNPVKFVNNQAEIDVTAQSSGALKRLHALVDLAGLNISADSDGVPVNVLQSPYAICKRVQVPTSGNAFMDATDSGNCKLQSLN